MTWLKRNIALKLGTRNSVVNCVNGVFLGLAAWVWVMSTGIKNIDINLNDDAWGALFSCPFTWLCIQTNPKSLGSIPCLPYADGVEHALYSGDRALNFGWDPFCLCPTPFFLIPTWLQLLRDAFWFRHNLGDSLGLFCTHHYCHGASVNCSLCRPEESGNSVERGHLCCFLDQLWNHLKISAPLGL